MCVRKRLFKFKCEWPISGPKLHNVFFITISFALITIHRTCTYILVYTNRNTIFKSFVCKYFIIYLHIRVYIVCPYNALLNLLVLQALASA